MFPQELLNSLGIRADSEKSQQVICYRTEDKPGGGFGGDEGEGTSEVCSSASLAGVGGWGIRMSREEG